MSYAPNTLRPGGGAPSGSPPGDRAERGDAGRTPRPTQAPVRDSARRRALGSAYDEDRDWARIGVFGAGVAVGAFIGAAVALLAAPQSGEDTRASIGRRARVVRERAADAWGDLGDELRAANRRGRRNMRRRLARSRWAAEDVIAG